MVKQPVAVRIFTVSASVFRSLVSTFLSWISSTLLAYLLSSPKSSWIDSKISSCKGNTVFL
nr:MAG TPA: hypothetical protein [Caudoviricetes sp.]DAX27248.1 MAG TPA: hypothetical protein [Caudoviricetes sp.]DAX94493.1 MAG TPA: hypothetical protein [Caudoviricetes sp.]